MNIDDNIINDTINSINFDMHKSYNGILLTDSEKIVLEHYGINVMNYNNLSSLIFDIECIINDEVDIDDLEEVLKNISEINYYANTKK